MLFEIASTSNTKYKYIKSLSQKKNRQKNGEYTVEGVKSVCDAIKSEKLISMIAVSDSFYEQVDFEYENYDILKVRDNIFSGICDTDTPQGIIAVIKMENIEFTANTEKVYIYCDNVTDPGNIGTIIRTADAAGMGGVLLSKGCVDIYNPKTVRASMGSFFHIPIIENTELSELKNLKQQGFQIISGAIGDNTIDYVDTDMKKPTIIVVGNEANGVCEEVISISDYCVKIPIIGMAESLNVAVAASILMYESQRQRR